MATININYGTVDECVNRISLLVSKISDISKNFEAITSKITEVPYWNSNSTVNYRTNCDSILENLNNAVENLNNYREILYRISSSYSKIENDIRNDKVEL